MPNQGKACCAQHFIQLCGFKLVLEVLKQAFQSLCHFINCGEEVEIYTVRKRYCCYQENLVSCLSFSLYRDVLTGCVLSRAKESMYHALGYSTIVVLQAVMTFEQQDIQNGISAMKDALQTCQKYD